MGMLITDTVMLVFNYFAPTAIALLTIGLPTPIALVRSHLIFLPPAIGHFAAGKVKSYEVEHIIRHLSYAISASVSIWGVDFDSVTYEFLVLYVFSQIGLYLFTLTHILEYFALATTRTHFGDTPALAFLLFTYGMFLGVTQDTLVYVFMRSVLVSIPMRVALVTLMLLAHTQFAQHATTRKDQPSFPACSNCGMMLASLHMCLLEANCQFESLALFPILAAQFVMRLEVQNLGSFKRKDMVCMLAASLLAFFISRVLYEEQSNRVALLGAGASFYFGASGRALLGERMYAAPILFASYFVFAIAHAWDSEQSIQKSACRLSAWLSLFILQFVGMERLV